MHLHQWLTMLDKGNISSLVLQDYTSLSPFVPLNIVCNFTSSHNMDRFQLFLSFIFISIFLLKETNIYFIQIIKKKEIECYSIKSLVMVHISLFGIRTLLLLAIPLSLIDLLFAGNLWTLIKLYYLIFYV